MAYIPISPASSFNYIFTTFTPKVVFRKGDALINIKMIKYLFFNLITLLQLPSKTADRWSQNYDEQDIPAFLPTRINILNFCLNYRITILLL
jgi:hypothetical protein